MSAGIRVHVAKMPYVSGVKYNIILPTKNSVGVYYIVAFSVLGEDKGI